MKRTAPSSSNSLQVPSASSPTSVRHLSPSRSPGKRGRSRKPPPPPTLKEQLNVLKQDRRVWAALALFALLVLALIISALRIASHSNEVQVYAPIPPAPTTTLATHHRRKPRVGRAGAPDAPAPASQAGEDIHFDDVVTEVLAETWDLPKEPQQEHAAAEQSSAPSQGTSRSYAELMQELEGMGGGITVDDLVAGLNQAYQE